MTKASGFANVIGAEFAALVPMHTRSRGEVAVAALQPQTDREVTWSSCKGVEVTSKADSFSGAADAVRAKELTITVSAIENLPAIWRKELNMLHSS